MLVSAPEVVGRVDLVVLISHKRADKEYNELRFVLRSFQAHFPRLGCVFIVGEDPPPWLRLDHVTHLPVMDEETWKDYNLFHKIAIACRAGLSRHFVFCSDDQFLLQPSEPGDFGPREQGTLTSWTEQTWQKKRKRHRVWYTRLRRTADVLAQRGKEVVYHFDAHHPVLVDRDLFPQVLEDYGVTDPVVAGQVGFTINTLYFNAIGAEPVRAKDLHSTAGVLPPPQTRFWNVNRHEDWPQAHAFLRERFPTPCVYESEGIMAQDQTGNILPSPEQSSLLDVVRDLRTGVKDLRAFLTGGAGELRTLLTEGAGGVKELRTLLGEGAALVQELRELRDQVVKEKGPVQARERKDRALF